jgi:hypothetical protein
MKQIVGPGPARLFRGAKTSAGDVPNPAGLWPGRAASLLESNCDSVVLMKSIDGHCKCHFHGRMQD